MSILIKGKRMPKCCVACWAAEICRHYDRFSNCERPEHCPLVEVPEPHGRLIDADFMKELGAKCIAKRCDDGVLLALGRIDDLPTVIEAEER